MKGTVAEEDRRPHGERGLVSTPGMIRGEQGGIQKAWDQEKKRKTFGLWSSSKSLNWSGGWPNITEKPPCA